MEGGGFDLGPTHLQQFRMLDADGGHLGLVGGLLVGVANVIAGKKNVGEPIPLTHIAAVKAIPGKSKGREHLVFSFVNGKSSTAVDVHDAGAFAAKVNEQIAKVKAAGKPAAAPAAPATVAKPGTVVTLDVRQKNLPGWQLLQQWPPKAFDCDPADVRLVVDGAGTTESMFLRTKEELGDGSVRLVYRFPVCPKFAYVALRVRSDGKTFAVVRLNNKGEFFAGTSAEAASSTWTRHPALHADPSQADEAVVELAGNTLRLSLNGALAVTKDGVQAPTGRVVIAGSANPKPAEISIGALSVHAK
jgi:hypothetical protein